MTCDLFAGLLLTRSICPAVRRRSSEIAHFESRLSRFPVNLDLEPPASIPLNLQSPFQLLRNCGGKSDRYQPKHSLVYHFSWYTPQVHMTTSQISKEVYKVVYIYSLIISVYIYTILSTSDPKTSTRSIFNLY